MPTQNSTIKSLFLDGPAGRLEALLNMGAVGATHAALVCHPHPLYGGTLHNKVVFRAAAGLLDAGLAALRFNFRGVGASTGTHDEGRGEQDDVRTALAFVERGECPLGIVYATDAGISDKVEVVATFPESSHAPIVYPVALVKGARGDAKAFLDYLISSPDAAAIYEHYGFTRIAK